MLLKKDKVFALSFGKHLSEISYRSRRSEVFCEKSVFENFVKFTGKQLCYSLFLNKVASLRQQCLQCLWFSNCVNIDGKLVCFREFSDKKVNFFKDILDENGNKKTCENILQQYKINK